MAHVLRRTIATFARTHFGAQGFPKFFNPKPRRSNMIFGFVACNFLNTQQITKNIELIKDEPETKSNQSELINNNNNNNNNDNNDNTNKDNRPLLVLLSWLMSKPKHVMKFANLYLEQGFDVVTVTINPWQLMWPANGSRVTANDLLKFLDTNKQYEKIMIHGFSVGGYMWGEVLDYVHQDRKRYDRVIERVVGHVWDSAADITEITVGTPRAIFPNNEAMQKFTKFYLELHMKTFKKQATQYYTRSSQLFHKNLVRTPALFLISNTDPVGSLESNMRVRDSWDSLGTETFVKIFDKTPHVGHFRSNPKEYVAELYSFMKKLQLIRNEDKIRARL